MRDWEVGDMVQVLSLGWEKAIITYIKPAWRSSAIHGDKESDYDDNHARRRLIYRVRNLDTSEIDWCVSTDMSPIA